MKKKKKNLSFSIDKCEISGLFEPFLLHLIYLGEIEKWTSSHMQFFFSMKISQMKCAYTHSWCTLQL